MWGIVLDPYPDNEPVYCSWTDTETHTDFDTQRVTTKNIELFCEFLMREEMLCGDSVRRVILLDDSAPYEGNPLNDIYRAAEFTLAYYKINTRECAAVECMISHSMIDYNNIFRYIDTDRTGEYSAFALETIGISDWREVFDGYDETLIVRRTIVETELKKASGGDESGSYTIFDSNSNLPFTVFTHTSGFDSPKYRSDESTGTSYDLRLLDNAAMLTRFNGRGSAVLGSLSSYPLDLSRTDALSFGIHVSSLPQGVTEVNLTVMLFSGDSRLEASGIVEGGRWNEFTADITPFVSTGRRIDRIRIMIGDAANTSAANTLTGNAVVNITDIKLTSSSLSSFELENIFGEQRDAYFTKPAREYDRKVVMTLCAVIAASALLLVMRRIRPFMKKDDDDDFTDMELWK